MTMVQKLNRLMKPTDSATNYPMKSPMPTKEPTNPSRCFGYRKRNRRFPNFPKRKEVDPEPPPLPPEPPPEPPPLPPEPCDEPPPDPLDELDEDEPLPLLLELEDIKPLPREKTQRTRSLANPSRVVQHYIAEVEDCNRCGEEIAT
ncbi:MAG: hypothetical protein SFV23_19920 [Planctomycetaceae bacterium]|nr:hypothetical protein [Planctomycetaceae bacterium]